MFKLASLAVLFSFLSVVSAHFQLQFPPPRGPFVEDNEPTFCDGYAAVASNRTQFPLGNTSISINSEHPKWTFGVLVSTVSNPTSFDNFSQAVPFFQSEGEGPICLAINLASVGNLTNGTAATLQFVFDGGDGKLFQCADVVLNSGLNISQSTVCNSSSIIATTSGASSSVPSATSPGASGTPSATQTPSNAFLTQASSASIVMSILGAALALM